MFYSTCIIAVFMIFFRILSVSLNVMWSILSFLRSFMPFLQLVFFLWRCRCISHCLSMWCGQFCLFWGNFGGNLSFMWFGNWCFFTQNFMVHYFYLNTSAHNTHNILPTHMFYMLENWSFYWDPNNHAYNHINSFLKIYIPTYIRCLLV